MGTALPGAGAAARVNAVPTMPAVGTCGGGCGVSWNAASIWPTSWSKKAFVWPTGTCTSGGDPGSSGVEHDPGRGGTGVRSPSRNGERVAFSAAAPAARSTSVSSVPGVPPPGAPLAGVTGRGAPSRAGDPSTSAASSWSSASDSGDTGPFDAAPPRPRPRPPRPRPRPRARPRPRQAVASGARSSCTGSGCSPEAPAAAPFGAPVSASGGAIARRCTMASCCFVCACVAPRATSCCCCCCTEPGKQLRAATNGWASTCAAVIRRAGSKRRRQVTKLARSPSTRLRCFTRGHSGMAPSPGGEVMPRAPSSAAAAGHPGAEANASGRGTHSKAAAQDRSSA